MRSTSAIWLPTVKAGLRLVVGSWKTIATSLPRTFSSWRGGSRRRSRPLSTMEPDAVRTVAPVRPRMASPVSVLPLPDSPTSPSVSPLAMPSERSVMTGTSAPSRPETMTCRPSTRSTSSLPCVHGAAPPATDTAPAAAGCAAGACGLAVTAMPRPIESRSTSPRRLTDSTVTMMAMPGGMARNQFRSMKAAAVLSIVPQLACGGWTPRPMKERPASASSTAPTVSVTCTISGGAMLGKMWRSRMRPSEAPTTRAERT